MPQIHTYTIHKRQASTQPREWVCEDGSMLDTLIQSKDVPLLETACSKGRLDLLETEGFEVLHWDNRWITLNEEKQVVHSSTSLADEYLQILNGWL